MNVQQVYAFLGGDYDAIYEALRSDALIARLLGLLSRDKSMPDLEAGIESADPEAAFRAAHTLKGVSGSLGFAELQNASQRTVDLIRAGDWEGAVGSVPEVKRLYARVCSALGLV